MDVVRLQSQMWLQSHYCWRWLRLPLKPQVLHLVWTEEVLRHRAATGPVMSPHFWMFRITCPIAGIVTRSASEGRQGGLRREAAAAVAMAAARAV